MRNSRPIGDWRAFSEKLKWIPVEKMIKIDKELSKKRKEKHNEGREGK